MSRRMIVRFLLFTTVRPISFAADLAASPVLNGRLAASFGDLDHQSQRIADFLDKAFRVF